MVGKNRFAGLPGVPTLVEAGYKNLDLEFWHIMFAPTGTPRPIIAAINRVVNDGMHTPQMEQRLAADGSQPAERMTPEELLASMKREYAVIEQQVKRLNIKIQ